MKKTMWVGMIGHGNSVVIGFDGDSVRCASTSPTFEDYVIKNASSPRLIEISMQDPQFNYPLYVASSATMSFGEEVPWNEGEFNMLANLAHDMRKQTESQE